MPAMTKKYISTCSDYTSPMPARKQNASYLVFTKPLPCLRWLKMYINICWPNHGSEDRNVSLHVSTKHIPCQRGHKIYLNMFYYTYLMPTRTQNLSQLVLTLPFQRGNKMYVNMRLPNLSLASKDTKCISICVDQTPSMSESKSNVSKHVLTKANPWKRGQKMHL